MFPNDVLYTKSNNFLSWNHSSRCCGMKHQTRQIPPHRLWSVSVNFAIPLYSMIVFQVNLSVADKVTFRNWQVKASSEHHCFNPPNTLFINSYIIDEYIEKQFLHFRGLLHVAQTKNHYLILFQYVYFLFYKLSYLDNWFQVSKLVKKEAKKY